MRKFAMVTAVAVSAIMATPAVARDGSAYVGVDAGAMIVQDGEFDYFDVSTVARNAIAVDHKVGFDAGILAGYDFGAFRFEVEAARKRAGVEEVSFDPFADIVPFQNEGANDADGRARVLSGMANGLLDFGNEGMSGFVGLGLGVAKIRYDVTTVTGGTGFQVSDNSLAWQALAGVRFPLTANLDAGLKYRFFNTRRLNFDGGSAAVPFELAGRFRSHSLLASLVYNFAAPVAPLPPVVETPPPPPPPATQTCPDGSVILATDTCPLPPAPPPPPPPTEERG